MYRSIGLLVCSQEGAIFFFDIRNRNPLFKEEYENPVAR